MVREEGIIKLKSGKKDLANYFGKKLTGFWNKITAQTENKNPLVIPVPSHKKRIKERGYCQSTLIAKEFSNNLRLDFSTDLLKRKKETQYMNSLFNIKERQLNIKNAFELIGSIQGKENIIIIDDILTSGSTMCEIAKTIHAKYPNIILLGLTVASGDTYN